MVVVVDFEFRYLGLAGRIYWDRNLPIVAWPRSPPLPLFSFGGNCHCCMVSIPLGIHHDS